MVNNLALINTGLEHCYINGIPIVEAIIDIDEIYKRLAKISSLAVQADPYFNDKTNAQKMFSEIHGEGDRLTREFLEEGARRLLSMMSPFQRLIPEGSYDTAPVTYEFDATGDNFSWTNPDVNNIFINSIEVKCISGNGDITFVVDGTELGTVTLPDFQIENTNYLAYNLAGYLGGQNASFTRWTHSENLRGRKTSQEISLNVSNNTDDFMYEIKINGVKYDAIGWNTALTEAGDVALPSENVDVRISNLIKSFEWKNSNMAKVRGAIVRANCGSAIVEIKYNAKDGTPTFITLAIGSVGEDYFEITEDISTVSVEVTDASEDFNYDFIINSEQPKNIPSPRFEFDTTRNPGKIIFRYQNMDSRVADMKLNYTSETLRDIRIDPNVFDEVLNYLGDALKDYVLREYYEAIGYDKKAVEYATKYRNSYNSAKFWIRSRRGLTLSYNYAGV